MDFEREHKLPEGVGKRIIDALKINKEQESEDFSEVELENQSSDRYQELEEVEYKNYSYDFSPKKRVYEEEVVVSNPYKQQESPKKDASGVEILVDLVSKLPPGVTKQTGAQIIRHTLEAMGISINQVLSKAQTVQEDLEQSIKNNINEIEENRSRIKALDIEIQQFKKKVNDLEDIISLFILSENNKR